MINCKNLSYSIGNQYLLKDIDCRLETGSISAIIGANGAGKSTLLKAFLGLITPQAGTVFFDQKPLFQWDPTALASRRAYMAQSTTVQMSIPVYEYLSLARLHFGESQKTTDAAVESIITQLNLMTLAQKSIDRLSGGEWQRIELARAWCQLLKNGGFDNTLLLLDEPGAALDIYQTQQLYKHLEHFKAQGGTAVVVEHDINTAARYCDQLLFLKRGELIDQGRVADSFTKTTIDKCFDVVGSVLTNSQTGHVSFVL
jgi:ABC-type hemin transport system ATPase subunit